MHMYEEEKKAQSNTDQQICHGNCDQINISSNKMSSNTNITTTCKQTHTQTGVRPEEWFLTVS